MGEQWSNCSRKCQLSKKSIFVKMLNNTIKKTIINLTLIIFYFDLLEIYKQKSPELK